MQSMPKYAGRVSIVGGAKTSKVAQGTAPDVFPKLRMADTVSECALVKAGVGGICMSAAALDKVTASLGIEPGDSAAQLEAAKEKLDCKTEKCVVKKSAGALGRQLVSAELARNFKIEGPTDNKLLSNTNIDDVMQQWARVHPEFFPYNFNMRDYVKYSFRNGRVLEQPDTLATVDFSALYEGRRGAHNLNGAQHRCCGCVINTDVYNGPGKHWMALFADARHANRWTVEFFNSSGNGPSPEWVNWLQKTKDQMDKIVARLPAPRPAVAIVRSNQLKHQQSRSECGVYALFYIWARLNDVPVEYFDTHRFDDRYMFEFRQYLFSDPAQAAMLGQVFDWDKFKAQVDIDWE